MATHRTAHSPPIHGGRQLSVLLPASVALALVIALAIQSVRASLSHRRAVDAALRDYAMFAGWQYARRTSDYLRLMIVSALADRPVAPGARIGSRDLASATITGDSVEVSATPPSENSDDVRRALARAIVETRRSGFRFGLVSLGKPNRHRYLGYALRQDETGRLTGGSGVVLSDDDLRTVFHHTASFAPLLPPAFVGQLPNDSLVTLEMTGADGEAIAHIGEPASGQAVIDSLGPALGAIQVRATLLPVAKARLVAGGPPSANPPALAAMLIAAFALCAVALMQLRRAQELVRLRADFVASVSHELKTPLAQISLFADTLAGPRERSSDDRRRYASIISREAKRLGNLVSRILHFAAIEPDASLGGARERLVLADEVEAALASFAPLAEAQSVTLAANVDARIEVPLDRDGFRQIMINLLDNALKFGPDGQTITTTAYIDRGWVVLVVDDEGPGIAESERVKVFDPFVRGAGERTGGSGIGLAVVRDVVARHGGRVRVSESPKGGARFVVELPDARALSLAAVGDE